MPEQEHEHQVHESGGHGPRFNIQPVGMAMRGVFSRSAGPANKVEDVRRRRINTGKRWVYWDDSDDYYYFTSTFPTHLRRPRIAYSVSVHRSPWHRLTPPSRCNMSTS